MAKKKVINNNLDYNLNGNYFNNVASEIIFSLGSFSITSNFDGRKYIDYNNELSSFVHPITLETLGLSETQSKIVYEYTTNATLNLNNSDLNTFVRYGSAYEFLRISIQNIIVNYPGSLFANSQTQRTGNVTFFDYDYDVVTNTSTFKMPTGSTVNTFGLVFDEGNLSEPDNNILKNLNLSFDKYIIWTGLVPENNMSTIIGFTGCSLNAGAVNHKYLTIKAIGNPFSTATETSATIDFHIKPNNVVFEEFRETLTPYEKYVVSERDSTNGFSFILKDPTLLDDGNIVYSDSAMLWSTNDGYNIDINTPKYQRFLEVMLTIGEKYDLIKTDLIARFLTPLSLKTYDLTDEGKMTKLLKIYGAEFDQLRKFIDSLVNINKVTYNKINNIPDQLVKNLARTFGWDYFSLINEGELVDSFLSIDETERNLNTDLLPAEIDIELWRRTLINTNYFWKSKGTREAIKSMFLLIGIPEPFINITEYVYTVDGKIDPRTVELSQLDFPSNSLPYDNDGYPVAPLETNDFFFQISGNTDSGQAYMDAFRMAGFNLMQTPDNKKSWVQSGSTTRRHYTTPQYYQEDSKLVLNTKEVDIALDTARGIEWDVWDYLKKDFEANSSGFTLPYSYVNISLGYTGDVGIFPIPAQNTKQGDFEVRFNGILLNAPSISGVTTGATPTVEADYIISGNSFILTGETGAMYARNDGYHKDVIQVTYINSGGTTSVSGITVEYIVTRVKAKSTGTDIYLPTMPRGDVQVTINGIALTKGTSQFAADYIVDPNNTTGSSKIIISNPDLISYLAVNPDVQVVYVEVDGSNDINARSEITRIDSFSTGKIYFNSSSNKFVYTLNYKASSASDLKILIDGIALEPGTDYTINALNPFEVFLPKGLKFGTIISVYYLVADSEYFNPIIDDNFGIGDISDLSFLEFIELLQRKMINVRNRKTISDFKGGWYPALLRVYVEYLKRSTSDTLQSNGYTFENLYSFLSKYNAFFQRFVDQLLSATIIQKGGGLLIRNTVFTKQKFMYRRGVNPDVNACISGETTQVTPRVFDLNTQYMGDDGAVFEILQPTLPPPPEPPTLYVETTEGVIGSIITGGENILGFDLLTSYGIDYRESSGTWIRESQLGSLAVDNFETIISGLGDDITYDYRAFIESGIYGYTGNTRQITTPPAPVVPSLLTRETFNVTPTTIVDTGGIDIVGYADIDYYAMQYRAEDAGSWEEWQLQPAPPTSGPLAVDNYIYTITGLTYVDHLYQYRAYMTIDGTAYCGDTREITTLPEPIIDPEVDTGFAWQETPTGFPVKNNHITVSGNSTILEYGILYTQSSAQGTSANLIYDNPLVEKDTPISITGGYYSGETTGLAANTTTYFRAFVRTADGVSHGLVKTAQTEPEPPPPEFPFSVSLAWTGPNDYNSGFGGVLKLYDGTTLIKSQVFSDYTKFAEVDWTIPTTGTYVLRFTDITVKLAGAEHLRDERWRWASIPTWYHTSQTTNITHGDPDTHVVFYEVQVLGGG